MHTTDFRVQVAAERSTNNVTKPGSANRINLTSYLTSDRLSSPNSRSRFILPDNFSQHNDKHDKACESSGRNGDCQSPPSEDQGYNENAQYPHKSQMSNEMSHVTYIPYSAYHDLQNEIERAMQRDGTENVNDVGEILPKIEYSTGFRKPGTPKQWRTNSATTGNVVTLHRPNGGIPDSFNFNSLLAKPYLTAPTNAESLVDKQLKMQKAADKRKKVLSLLSAF